MGGKKKSGPPHPVGVGRGGGGGWGSVPIRYVSVHFTSKMPGVLKMPTKW